MSRTGVGQEESHEQTRQSGANIKIVTQLVLSCLCALVMLGLLMVIVTIPVTALSGSPLPLPSSLPLDAYERQLYDFLDKHTYETLGWVKDKGVPLKEITVPIRENFARHTLQGINLFGLEMFNQFDEILGPRKPDYMTGFTNGLQNAITNGIRFAQEETAKIEILNVSREGNQLAADVKVTNITGHRFPSGVGFRRAFIEFEVLDAQKMVVWSSGRANSLGIIVDEKGQPLPSEFLKLLNPKACARDPKLCVQAYEPHYQTITRQDQVQIYQELVKNPENKITTSFVALANTIKDNRLLPKGWTKDGPPGFASDPKWGPIFIDATTPKGNVRDDTQFFDGTGTDVVTYKVTLPEDVLAGGTVVATLHYQTAKGDDGRRLHYITSRLNLEGTAIEDWKLPVAQASASIK